MAREGSQATVDLTLYIVFFLPGVFALTYAGYFYAMESWAINEHSTITYEGPPLYPFKMVIPLAGAFVLGFAWALLAEGGDDVTWRLVRGEHWGIVGANGGGGTNAGSGANAGSSSSSTNASK